MQKPSLGCIQGFYCDGNIIFCTVVQYLTAEEVPWIVDAVESEVFESPNVVQDVLFPEEIYEKVDIYDVKVIFNSCFILQQWNNLNAEDSYHNKFVCRYSVSPTEQKKRPWCPPLRAKQPKTNPGIPENIKTFHLLGKISMDAFDAYRSVNCSLTSVNLSFYNEQGQNFISTLLTSEKGITNGDLALILNHLKALEKRMLTYHAILQEVVCAKLAIVIAPTGS